MRWPSVQLNKAFPLKAKNSLGKASWVLLCYHLGCLSPNDLIISGGTVVRFSGRWASETPEHPPTRAAAASAMALPGPLPSLQLPLWCCLDHSAKPCFISCDSSSNKCLRKWPSCSDSCQISALVSNWSGCCSLGLFEQGVPPPHSHCKCVSWSQWDS